MKKRFVTYLYIIVCAATSTVSAQLLSTDPDFFSPQAANNNQLSETETSTLKAATQLFAEQSVLASGKWVKVSVEKSGMKQISYASLKKMGFADPSRVAIYGNGGKEVPLSNSAARPDDLAQLPVLHSNNSIIFYAEGVETWTYNSKARFICNKHQSDHYSYYFITEGEPSAQPNIVARGERKVSRTFDTYDNRQTIQYHKENILKSGRTWWSAVFNQKAPHLTETFSFDDVAAEPTGVVNLHFAVRDGAAGSFSIKINGQEQKTGTYKSTTLNSSTTTYAYDTDENVQFVPSATNSFDLGIVTSSSQMMAWVDYITMIVDSKLNMLNKSELLFRNVKSYTSRGVSQYNISGAKQGMIVWDITDPRQPQQMETSFADGVLSFVHTDKSGSEFVVFDPQVQFEEPTIVGEVPNQNLHAQQAVNYVIVTHPDFLVQAERLAQIHRQHNGLSVAVATTEQIYNEFSSGKREPGAIRDYLRMIYNRTDSVVDLRSALLFGTGNYDPLAKDKNFVPVYESSTSLHQSQTYVTDDYYGWVAKGDGSSDLMSRMRIGIGRFPVSTQEEAKVMVDKSEIYLLNEHDGAWRNKVVFVADDGDKLEHFTYADKNAKTVEQMHPDLNLKKIYTEAYASESTSTGIQYPRAIEEFTNFINSGALLMNYIGHGGGVALGGENMLPQARIAQYTNPHRLSFFITSTCDFAPFDNWRSMSAGEELVLSPNSGFFGIYSTTRTVFGDSNFRFHNALLKRILSLKDNGEPYSIGEAAVAAKQDAASIVNTLKFVLLGDPALSLRQKNLLTVSTDKVNGEDFEAMPRISALQNTTLEGAVRDTSGAVINDFNGEITVTLYDKPKTKKTSGLSGQIGTFEEYANVLYNGLVEVKNGRFSTRFTLSKDIDVSEGFGRLSYYAVADDKRNVNAFTNEILIGGIATELTNDVQGPTINAWIDYPTFVDGGPTGSNPVLYAEIEDPSCINISGTGVGHDLSLVIDGDRNNPINLNNVFTYEMGSSTKGKLTYVLRGMSDGEHTVALKAWDNMNNSTTATLNFVACERCDIRFERIEIFPQPLSAKAASPKLRFVHNEGAATLNIGLSVYTMTGNVLGEATVQSVASEFQTETIDLGSALPQINTLPRGIYMLRLTVGSNSGRHGEVVKKLMVGQ